MTDSSSRTPLRVAYDHTIFTVQVYGGVSRYFAELIPRVARTPDVEACLFMGLHMTNYPLGRARGDLHAFWGLRRPMIPKTHRAALGLGNWLFARRLKTWAPRVYHATGYTRLAPRVRVARVVTVHDFIHERVSTAANPWFPQVKASIDGADGLVCVSQNTKRDLMDLLGVPERKIRVVYHGNSLTGVAPGPPPVEGPYLLFVGVRFEYKNFPTLLKAYAASPRLRADFRLACFGGRKLTEAEMSEAAALGVADRLVWIAGGSDRALAGAYAHAAAFVYPSVYEGFGLSLLEAMSQGCPVVSSNTSSLPEVGGDAAVYFDPRRADELMERIESVVYDTARADELRAKGRARDAAFSWDRCAAETLGFYREVAGG